MKVYVHFANGFEEIEALTVVDVLRRAEIHTETVSVSGDLMVTGAHGVPVRTDILFDEADYENCSMIVLPGGMPGTANLAAHEGLTQKIKEFAVSKKWMAAICAAPMVLGELGLLKGKTAVIYPGMEEHLINAKTGRNNVEIDGAVITSKGPGTAMEFALTLVKVLKDMSTVKQLKNAMLLEK
ncbi:MAG: DJ-1/PfpI family protein [Eubacteriales bacterium]|nr:DJ-1/PfpI family protein [Eubacteriales bacterium]